MIWHIAAPQCRGWGFVKHLQEVILAIREALDMRMTVKCSCMQTWTV